MIREKNKTERREERGQQRRVDRVEEEEKKKKKKKNFGRRRKSSYRERYCLRACLNWGILANLVRHTIFVKNGL